MIWHSRWQLGISIHGLTSIIVSWTKTCVSLKHYIIPPTISTNSHNIYITICMYEFMHVHMPAISWTMSPFEWCPCGVELWTPLWFVPLSTVRGPILSLLQNSPTIGLKSRNFQLLIFHGPYLSQDRSIRSKNAPSPPISTCINPLIAIRAHR